MKAAGAEVTIIGSKAGAKYRGKRHKAEVISDIAADELDNQKFDAVIVPGGYAPDKMRLNKSMIYCSINEIDILSI